MRLLFLQEDQMFYFEETISKDKNLTFHVELRAMLIIIESSVKDRKGV